APGRPVRLLRQRARSSLAQDCPLWRSRLLLRFAPAALHQERLPDAALRLLAQTRGPPRPLSLPVAASCPGKAPRRRLHRPGAPHQLCRPGFRLPLLPARFAVSGPEALPTVLSPRARFYRLNFGGTEGAGRPVCGCSFSTDTEARKGESDGFDSPFPVVANS